MKKIVLNLIIIFVLFNQFAIAAETQLARVNGECAIINPKENIQSFWYVSTDRSKVHFVSKPGGESLKKYVIKGDLVVASTETPEFICAQYIKKGKVVASGWINKSEIETFKHAGFGDSEALKSNKSIPQTNKALVSLAKRLPQIKDWQGTFQDSYGNSVKIWKKGSTWRLSMMGITGSIGTGNEEEDSLKLVTYGARAEYRDNKEKYDVCDIVIIGFNNALLATSGSHCMGSGANHEYPEFNGLYWRR